MTRCPCCGKGYAEHLDPSVGELYRQGKRPSELAQTFHVSVTTVFRRLHALGVTVRNQKEGYRFYVANRPPQPKTKKNQWPHSTA